MFFEPTITVRSNGAVAWASLKTSCNPVGDECRDRVTVCGSSSTDVDALIPPLSVAVKVSTRCDGYSWSGAANDPLAIPGQVWTSCGWQVDGQCRIVRSQLSAAAGSAPSCASVADPLNEIGSPTFQVSEAEGLEIIGTGGSLPALISFVAVSLAPSMSVTCSPTWTFPAAL